MQQAVAARLRRPEFVAMAIPPRAPESGAPLTAPAPSCALTLATGQVLALITATLHRNGVASALELSEVLTHLAAMEPATDETRILALWASMIRESARAIDAIELEGRTPKAH